MRRSHAHGTCGHLADRTVGHGRWYVVRRGDSLWTIARAHYRDGHRYHLLLDANPGIRNRSGVIKPCERIVIPRARKH